MFDGNWAVKYVPRKVEVQPWKKWFAWRPIKIHSKRVWFKTVYRKGIVSYVDNDKWLKYKYGTLFDVLKDAE